MRYWKQLLLFYLGGMGYAALELLWRGRTHGSMFVLGGACFLALGKLVRLRLPRPLLAVLGSGLITAGELLTGLLVNGSYLVWDYRRMPMNFRGQICLRFSLLWIPVSALAMGAYGLISRKIPDFSRKNRNNN